MWEFGSLRGFSFGFGFECSIKAKGRSVRDLRTFPKGSRYASSLSSGITENGR